jgi:hypothetical protein
MRKNNNFHHFSYDGDENLKEMSFSCVHSAIEKMMHREEKEINKKKLLKRTVMKMSVKIVVPERKNRFLRTFITIKENFNFYFDHEMRLIFFCFVSRCC